MIAPETRFAVLIFTDIVGSTELKTHHGVPAYREALGVHNRHFESLAATSPGFRNLQNTGDDYFAEAPGVAEAERFALLFQQAMREGPWGEVIGVSMALSRPVPSK
jgi:class 3 adenylate cyclase